VNSLDRQPARYRRLRRAPLPRRLELRGASCQTKWWHSFSLLLGPLTPCVDFRMPRTDTKEPALPDSTYRAFVSYSHASDQRLANSLQSSLSRFAKPWYRLRSMRIFQDEASLSANPALWNAIETALAQCEYFVLLASQASAKSRWVHQEVQWWCSCA
jgi:hypothetical protein